ncbi:MAG: LamG domain-containing protein [Candidatus Aenigmarchaeota archaeon]|nr:LamG domain-containing protein [Candidatus Aenigmarchaeota archaeon]
MRALVVIFSMILVLSIVSIGYSAVASGLPLTTSSQNPVLSLEMDDAPIRSPTVVDSSSNHNNGLCSATSCPSPIAGLFGSALSFDGVNKYVSVADSSSLDPTDAITISAWFYARGYGNSAILMKGPNQGGYSDSNSQYGIFFKDENAVAFRLSGVGEISYRATTYDNYPSYPNVVLMPSVNKWHNIVGTYDGAKMQLWIDGNMVKEISVSGKISVTADPLYIGSRNSDGSSDKRYWNYFFNGLIDETLIYNRAISVDEMQQLYKNGLTGKMGTYIDETLKNNATCFGSSCPSSIDGKNGKALQFDAANKNYVELKKSADLPLRSIGFHEFGKQYSASFWFKTSVKNGGLYSLLPGYEGVNNDDRYRNLYLQNGNICQDFGWNSWNQCIGGTDYADDQWHNVIQTMLMQDDSHILAKVYVDGVEKYSTVPGWTGTIPNADRVWVGFSTIGQGESPSYFSGAIDDFRIYDRAITADEAQQIYTTNDETIPNNLVNLKFEDQNNIQEFGDAVKESLVSDQSLLMHMNEQSLSFAGVVKDSSGLANDGTCSGASCPVFGEKGKFTTALKFNGNNYIEVKNSPTLSITGPVTVETWVNPTKFDSYDPIISSGSYGIERKSEGELAFWVNDGSWKESHSSTDIPLAQWTHVVGVYDGTNLKIYINGVQSGSMTASGNPIALVSSITIGHNPAGNDPGRWFDGSIDRTKIYNRALSDSEIASAYQEGLGKQTEESLDLSLDESTQPYLDKSSEQNSGTCLQTAIVSTPSIVADSSSSGNNGANHGATFTEGKFKDGLKFDGSSNYVDFGSTFNYQDFAISMWVNPAASQNQYADILDNNHDGDSNWVLQQDNSNTNQYGWGGFFTLSANTWQHLVIMRSGTTCYSYVNGVLVTSATCYPNGINYDNSPFRNLNIGRHNTIGRYWAGSIDELSVFNRALSESEIASLMNDPNSVQGSVLLLNMDKNANGKCPVSTQGILNSAQKFDGINYIKLNPLTLTDFTTSVWINPSQLPENDGASILNNEQCGAINDWGLQLNKDGTVRVQIGKLNSGDTFITSVNSIPLNQWTHLIVTRNTTDGSIKIFINGELDSTGVAHKETVGSSDGTCDADKYKNSIGIGNTERLSALGVRGFVGSIDEVRVYKRTFSSEEIQNFYQDQGSRVIEINQGWNFISSPYASFVTDTDCTGLSIYHYNSLSASYEKIDYLTKINPGLGYWINSSSSCNIEFSGTKLLTYDMLGDSPGSLKLGWNQIAGTTISTDIYYKNGNCNISAVYDYNSTAKKYYKASFIEPEKSYWVYAKGKTIEIPQIDPNSCSIGRNVIEMQKSCEEFTSKGATSSVVDTPEGQKLRIDLGQIRDIQQILSRQPYKETGDLKIRTSVDDKEWTAWNILRSEKIPSLIIVDQFEPIPVRYIEVNLDSEINAYAEYCKNKDDTGDETLPAMPILNMYDKTPTAEKSDAVMIEEDKQTFADIHVIEDIYAFAATSGISLDRVKLGDVIFGDYLKDYKIVVIPHYIDNIPSQFLSDLADAGVVVVLYNDATYIANSSDIIKSSSKYISMKDALSKTSEELSAGFIIDGNEVLVNRSDDFQKLVNLTKNNIDYMSLPSETLNVAPITSTGDPIKKGTVVWDVTPYGTVVDRMDNIDLPVTIKLYGQGLHEVIVYTQDGGEGLSRMINVTGDSADTIVTGQVTGITGMLTGELVGAVTSPTETTDVEEGTAVSSKTDDPHTCVDGYCNHYMTYETLTQLTKDRFEDPKSLKPYRQYVSVDAQNCVSIGIGISSPLTGNLFVPVSLAVTQGRQQFSWHADAEVPPGVKSFLAAASSYSGCPITYKITKVKPKGSVCTV